MSRTDSFIGLNQRAKALVEGLKSTVYSEFEGAFYNRSSLSVYFEEDSYGLSTEARYIEFIQDSPWASGPNYFIALMDIYGGKIEESLWTEKEIESFL